MSYIRTIRKEGIELCYFAENNETFFLQENLKKELPKGSGKEIPMLKGEGKNDLTERFPN